jgi:hypothetical protein
MNNKNRTIVCLIIAIILLFVVSHLIFKTRKKLPILFIHIPKTGGNSIKKTKIFKDCIFYDHSSIRKIGNIPYRYSFAIVRNPYDRLVSAYFYLKNGGMKHEKDRKRMQKQEKYTNFKMFVQNLDKFVDDIHYKPQYMFLIDSNGKIVVDNILRQEQLDADFSKLQKYSGYEVELLQKTNKSEHNHYTEYYDNEISEMVYNIYKKDFELLKYAK